MKTRNTILISFVAAVCVVALGFVLFFDPVSDTALNSIEINDEPVALGAEDIYDAKIIMLTEGQGTVEVSPYKSGYYQGETVNFTALAFDGWEFDHWEGDIDDYYAQRSKLSFNMPGGELTLKAVFKEK